jgi:hypothetical protein
MQTDYETVGLSIIESDVLIGNLLDHSLML